MSVTREFSLTIARAVAGWGASANPAFRLSSDGSTAVSRMGEDTLELSARTGNVTVRPPSGRAVAVLGLDGDGMPRIDCGGGSAEIPDEALAEEVAAVLSKARAALGSALARGNRTSFVLAPANRGGTRLHAEADGRTWHWLETAAELEADRKALGHDLEPEEGQAIVVSLRGPSGRRIGTALIGTEGLVDYVSKTELPQGLSGPRAIQARLNNNPDAIDVALGDGEWELPDGIVVLDGRDLVHNAFGPAFWSDDTENGVIACQYVLDGKRVGLASYPHLAAASAAAGDPSLRGDETASTVDKWVARRLEAETERLEGQDNVGILEIDARDEFLVDDGTTMFERMGRAATAENVERICVYTRFGVEKGDRALFVEGALASGLLSADRADPSRLAGFAKRAGAPAPVVRALRAMDAEEARAAVGAVMGGKLSGDWSGLAPEPDVAARPKAA